MPWFSFVTGEKELKGRFLDESLCQPGLVGTKCAHVDHRKSTRCKLPGLEANKKKESEVQGPATSGSFVSLESPLQAIVLQHLRILQKVLFLRERRTAQFQRKGQAETDLEESIAPSLLGFACPQQNYP